jgi:hypothetical protein
VYECLETNFFSSDNWNLVFNIDLSVLPSHPTNSTDHLNPTLATIPGSSTGTGGPAATGFQQHSSFTSVRGFDPTLSLNNPKNNGSFGWSLLGSSADTILLLINRKLFPYSLPVVIKALFVK